MIIRRSKKEPAAECSETRRALEAKHERQRMRERKTESILDMLKGIGDLNVEDALLVKQLLNNVSDAAEEAKQSVSVAQRTERSSDIKEAQNDLDHWCRVAEDALAYIRQYNRS